VTARREYTLVWLALAVVAVGLLLAWQATWAAGTEKLSSGGIVEVSASGAQITPLGSAAAVVIIAMAVLVLITGRILRVIAGVIISVSAIAAAFIGLRVVTGVQQAALWNTYDGVIDVSATLWGWVAVLLALIAAVLGVLVAVRARRWPGFSTRYDRGARQPRDAWEALDRGLDPTLDE
jgi:glucan phosphoethanolaminetransferase (alkaline phosphatase superfamily)